MDTIFLGVLQEYFSSFLTLLSTITITVKILETIVGAYTYGTTSMVPLIIIFTNMGLILVTKLKHLEFISVDFYIVICVLIF